VAARDERLDRDAIPDLHPPALRGPVADALDDAERLVARDDRQADRQHACVLLASLPQIPHASTRRSPLSSSMSGIGSSRSSRRRGAVWTITRLVRAMGDPNHEPCIHVQHSCARTRPSMRDCNAVQACATRGITFLP
jgi:hypothetical protein